MNFSKQRLKSYSLSLINICYGYCATEAFETFCAFWGLLKEVMLFTFTLYMNILPCIKQVKRIQDIHYFLQV